MSAFDHGHRYSFYVVNHVDEKNTQLKKKKLTILVSFHFVHGYCSCVHNINLIQECWLMF